MKTLTLYRRAECHLCELLVDELAPFLEAGARLELVDIAGNPELERRYGLRIPVLVGGGRELSSYPLDAAAVRSFLASTGG